MNYLIQPDVAFYQQRNHTLLLDGEERRYVLTIHDLPQEEKPREKLVAHGPESLTLVELLAVILVTGTKKEDVLSLTSRIIKEYGKKSILSQRDARTLSLDLSIPLGKATQIIAVGELGRRLFARNANSAPVIRTAREVFEYTADMRNLKKEHLRGLYLNAHYKVIYEETLSIGTVDSSIIHPREVFKPAIEYGAAAVILIHNHPSGIVKPSENDQAMTEQLVKAGRLLGIDLIDHLIVTKEKFASIL